MAIIAIRQPNNLLMMFSTVSNGPLQINLNREEFIKEYVNCFDDCKYMTTAQAFYDAVNKVDNHVNPWDRFLESYIPCYARTEEEISEAFEEYEKKCSVKPIKELRND